MEEKNGGIEVEDVYSWESVNGRVRGRHSQSRRLGMGMLASSRLWLQLDAAEQEAGRPGNALGGGELVSRL